MPSPIPVVTSFDEGEEKETLEMAKLAYVGAKRVVTLTAACTTECGSDGSGGAGNHDGVDCNLNATTNTWVAQRSTKCEMLRLDHCE